jgi:CBS domain-containing protein
MKTAEEIMEKEVISVTPDTDISRAVEILLNNHINGVPVVDESGALKGILCQSDLIFQQKNISLPPILTFLDGIIPLSSSKKMDEEMKKMAASTVAQAMVADPVTVTPDTPISDIAMLMVEKHFHTIPVVQDGKVVGIVGKEDVLKTLIKQ